MAVSHHLFELDLDQHRVVTGRLLYTAVPPVFCGRQFSSESESGPVVERFLQLWGTGFYSLPLCRQLSAAQAWDSLHLLARALAAIKVQTRQRLRQALEENVEHYCGLIGTFAPDKYNHSGLLPSSLFILRCMGKHWYLVKNR